MLNNSKRAGTTLGVFLGLLIGMALMLVILGQYALPLQAAQKMQQQIPSVGSITGVVVNKFDSPVGSGQVIFRGGGFEYSAFADADGKFSLVIPKGTYSVIVVDRVNKLGFGYGFVLIPTNGNAPELSPNTFKVEAGQVVNIRVE